MPKKATKDRKRLLANLKQVNEELDHLRNMMQGEVDVELDEGDTEIVERGEDRRPDHCAGAASAGH